MRIGYQLLVLSLLFSAELHAQRRCTKGIPCGNTCIAANKTCRVGSTTPPRTATPQATAPQPRGDSVVRLLYGTSQSNADSIKSGTANDTLFVGSRVDGVFFLRTCLAAQDLAPENRRYFKTEKEALDAKYRRSRVPGC
jgi:hypothetical protein